ncbi:hypothetical protein A3740_21955 [Oleiphilus sp. HI0068]|nr:hypothetical protein A3740_21955 [Oleiphilus sp. HI0068]
MDAGRISISVSFDYERSGSELKISLRDTGKGFDFASQNEDLAMNTKPWGRGIALVRSLCETVEYSDEGRCVEATLALNPNDRKERYPPIAPA